MALPSGYTQLTYIKSNGSQYLNTNRVPTANTRVTMDFQLTAAGNNNLCLFGVVGQFSFRWYGSNSAVFRSNGSNGVNFPTGISGTARHTVDKTATTCTLDGTYSVTNTPGTVSNPLYLFAQNTGSGVSNYASAIAWSFRWYENGSLILDYVPAIRDSDGVAGMYDVINDEFHGSDGSEAFIAGDVYDPTAPVGDHNTLIDGTAREMEGGSVMVGGTVYEIENGTTLVDGTVHEISFGPSIITVNMTGSGNMTYAYVTINRKNYYNQATLTIESGTEIRVYLQGSITISYGLTLNGESIEATSGRTIDYTFVPNTETVNIKFTYSSSQRYITITTS